VIEPVHNLEARWARLGVLLNTQPSPHAPDVERTLLDTVRVIPNAPHLIPLVVTWLAEHGLGVARHRLKHLAIVGLTPEHRPVLGLLLDEAVAHGAPAELRIIRDICQPAANPGPLVAAFRAHPALIDVAESEASERSRQWGVWLPPVQLKPDAIRPASWIREHNPSWAARVVRRGDLRASIIESLRLDFDGHAPAVAAIAEKTAATRLAVNSAVQALEREGAVRHAPKPSHARARPVELLAA
tara:strand:+ start:35912 stop:36640 length:729 start_codon:yes stop_codon:yes gene_type:complete